MNLLSVNAFAYLRDEAVKFTAVLGYAVQLCLHVQAAESYRPAGWLDHWLVVSLACCLTGWLSQ